MTRRATSEAERTLPSNLEAERSVLGAILLDSGAYEKAAAVLSASDFFRDAHRRIFKAFDRLLEWDGGVVDMVTLREDLEKHGDLDEVGPAYLPGLIDGVPRSTNVEHYARIVREKAQLRALIAAGNKIVSAAYAAEETPAEILAKADRVLVDLQAGSTESSTLALRESAKLLLDDLEFRVAHRGELIGADTGFGSINEITNGWQTGLIVIGARPSIGKTTFVVNGTGIAAAKAFAAAKSGKQVAVFSLEMERKELEYRIVSSLSGVPLSRLLSGCLMQADWGPVSAAVGTMGELPLHINDRSGLTVGEIRSECRRLRAEEGPIGLVIIDYVQLMAGMLEDRRASRNDQITDTSRRCKALAKELQAPVILLSQLSRANEKRPDPRPKLSDLRESGALEQDADIVGFLHRKNHREGGLTYFIVEKDRSGPTGTLKLSLDRDVVTFTDAPDLPEPVEARRTKKSDAAPDEKDRYSSGS